MSKKPENMDTDDDSNPIGVIPFSSNIMTTTVAPNDFHLSTYKENTPVYKDHSGANSSSTLSMNTLGHSKTSASSYKCCLCRKIVDDSKLICAKCVNIGRFCPSKHDTCSQNRRQTLMNMLNINDREEFQQYTNQISLNSPVHLQCADRMFLLKKFNAEKKNLQNEYQTKMEPTIRLHQMSEQIQIRKNRLNLVRQRIERLRRQNVQNEHANVNAQHRIEKRRMHVEFMIRKINDAKELLKSSTQEVKRKHDIRIEQENKLLIIRRQRLNELNKYVFPIELTPPTEEGLASRIKALSSAQRPIADEANCDSPENEENINIADRYQIVNSYLPVDGKYQIDNLVAAASFDGETPEIVSPHSTRSHESHESHEVLSGLSHSCQLINVIAFYLHITLPFRLHHVEFNNNNLTNNRLRSDIAKLNANIVSSCLSQGIRIEKNDVMHTLENLWKLLTFKRFLSRPMPVEYSQKFIDMMEEEVNEISRAYVTDYWFDDVDKDVNDLLNSDEWETIPNELYIPDDRISSDANATPTDHNTQNQSNMINSIDYWKERSSTFFSSVFRPFAKQ